MTIKIIKKIGKRLLQILVILLITVVVLLLSLGIFHQITRESGDDYLPGGAQAYIEIDSFRDFYNDVIDLKALEIVLSHDDWSNFFQTVLDFKNNQYSQSFIFQQLLNLRTTIVLHDDFSPSLIIDPRLKGMFTRFIPLFMKNMRNDQLAVTISTVQGETMYTLTYKDEARYYLIFKKNLILLALNQENLMSLIAAGQSGQGSVTRHDLEQIEKVSVKKSILDMHLKTNGLFSGFSENESTFGKIFTLADFPSYTSVSLALSNREINIKASAEIQPKTEIFRGFLAHDASPLGVIKILPDSTNVYSSVNFKSFGDLYEILSTLDGEYVLEDYDGLLKFLSGMTSEEILFSWTGSEAGFFSIETAPEPVIYIKVGDNDKLTEVLTSIDKSVVLNTTDTLIINEVRINQFEYTPLVRAGMTLAKKSLELPYFIQFKGYLFLSMNPESLAQMVQKERLGELLLKEKTYKSITARIPRNANFFFFYDLNSAIPRFIAENPLLSQLLQEYEKGVVSLFYTENKITFNLSAEPSGSLRTTLFPGYPQKVNGVSSQVFAADVQGGDSVELIYLTKDNDLHINDLTNNPLAQHHFDHKGCLSLMPGNDLFYNDREGGLFKITGEGQVEAPYPQFTEAKDSFPPVFSERGMILYSSSAGEIQYYSYSGILQKSIPVEKTVFSTPLLFENKLYYYPKSLMGTVYSSTLSGEQVEGWPQDTMGISFSTPFHFEDSIGFLTQMGNLFLWDTEGGIKEGFPIKLNGVYYATPVSFHGTKNLMALISSDGLVSLVDENGNIETSRYFENLTGKDLQITSYKPEDSKEDLLFLYGGSNYITAVNLNLQILEGFPVKGFTKPSFFDINRDGSVEFITAGYDNKLYIYTLRNEK